MPVCQRPCPASSSRPRTWSGSKTSPSQPASSPVLPDLSICHGLANGNPTSTNDWHYSWMFTGQQTMARPASTFDGNIVIFENRPFGIERPGVDPQSARRHLPGVPGRRRDGRRGDLRLQRQYLRRRPERSPASAPAPIAPSCCAGMRASPTRWSRWATGSPT